MYAVVAFVLTHLPGSSVPKVSWLDRVPAADKIVHAGLYFLLAVLLANCLRFWLRSNRVIVLLTLGTLAGYAAFDEWSQRFSPSRSPDVLDFVADMIGATCGVSLFAIGRWLRRQKRLSKIHSNAEATLGRIGQALPGDPPVAVDAEPAECPTVAGRQRANGSSDSPSRERSRDSNCEPAGQTRVTL
jgi:VanZ family protein